MSNPSLQRKTEQAGTEVKLVVLVVVVFCLAAGVIWFSRPAASSGPGAIGNGGFSEGTLMVLSNLNSPVSIHFYTLLDKASVPAGTFAFAERVNDLLTQYQQTGGGKISVTRFKTGADADAADADGIKPFNQDKGDACYLGLSVNCNGQKESFPKLSAEWEAALEADLSRAIARLSVKPQTSPAAMPAGPAATSAPSVAAVNDLKLALTNLAEVTVADGSQLLRVAAFQDYAAVAAEMQAKLNEARQRLAAAQNGGSEADLQAAKKQLQWVEAEQSEKLGQIAARLQSRINTLEQVKKP